MVHMLAMSVIYIPRCMLQPRNLFATIMLVYHGHECGLPTYVRIITDISPRAADSFGKGKLDVSHSFVSAFPLKMGMPSTHMVQCISQRTYVVIFRGS